VLALFARLLVLELAKVHDLDHRRVGGRRDFNNIEPPFFGDAEGVLEVNLAEVLTLLVNGPDARGAYLVVDAVAAARGFFLVTLHVSL
jgi:hypothetical protein